MESRIANLENYRCFVKWAMLSDGTRVLTQSDMMRALGRARQAKGRAFYKGDVNLPAFLTAQNLKPFIPNELYVTSSQVEFTLPSGQKAFGYRAEMLPAVRFQKETLPEEASA